MTAGAPLRALILGCGGQDGSYLAELLLSRGYEVLGAARDPVAVASEYPALSCRAMQLLQLDLRDTSGFPDLLAEYKPAEVYNFASVSFGPDAWVDPVSVAETGATAVARILEAVASTLPTARFFQASSAWIFGRPVAAPQDEFTPLAPVEPYGAAKAYAHTLIQWYRESRGLFACSGIFFNHESPRRSEQFLTRKVSRAAARIKLGLQEEVVLGDMDARRDWGYAADYVEAAWLALQARDAQDYVIASGDSHSVTEFVELAFDRVGLDWRDHVRQDAGLMRPVGETVDLVGDPSRARRVLGWSPRTSLQEVVAMMVDADLELARKESPA